MLNKLPEKQHEQVLVASFRQKLEMQRSSERGKENEDELNLSTGGSKTRIVMNPIKKSKVEFSTESLINFQLHTGVSLKRMKKVTNYLRNNAGRSSVLVHYENDLSKKSKTLEHVYHEGYYDFDVEGDKTKLKRPVVWADAEELLEVVLEKRQQIGDVNTRSWRMEARDFSK